VGSRGGAPGWVYRREAAIREASHSNQHQRSSELISELEKKNIQLQLRIEELEKELELLRKK